MNNNIPTFKWNSSSKQLTTNTKDDVDAEERKISAAKEDEQAKEKDTEYRTTRSALYP